jgi:benzoate/toluate 1,2-dioxygenase alpha subunit/2,4,5-trichlorophenoxyacetic acid oxygenase 1
MNPSISESPSPPALDIDALLDDRAQEGVFRVHRRAFTDAALFTLEMQRIFESSWVFVGLESELAKPHDYVTTTIGRQPVVISRNDAGEPGCFLNSCRHRGMMVCPLRSGNAKFHICRYHGWVYDSGGRNVGITNRPAGRYPGSFDLEDHGLVPVARFAGYRGFLFASLSADVPPLEEHLGEARLFLDLVADQARDGLEYVPGSIGYTFDANWKLQIENSLDMYHFASTHVSYIDLLSRRGPSELGGNAPPTAGAQGTFSFGRGHAVMWREKSRASPTLLALRRESFAPQLGEVKERWATYARNLTIFPNLQIVDNITSVMLRELRPLAVDRTELRTHCLAPIGEDAQSRRARIRDYEDFFNPSGLATPDDNVVYEQCQTGYDAAAAGYTQGYLRGLGRQDAPATNPHAEELQLERSDWSLGSRTLGDETCFHDAYREWRRLLKHEPRTA